MSDIFKEVDEDVRHDELRQLWKQWGPWFIGVIATFLIVWSGVIFWRNYVQDAIEADSASFADAVALIETDPDAAMTALAQLSNDGTDGYGALASLRSAALLLDQGKWQDAVAAYDGLAGNDKISQHMREYAQLLAAMVVAENEGDEAVRARLETLAAGEGAWRYSARELIGVLDFRAGDLDSAEQTFSEFSFAEGAPGAVRQRAQEMLDLIDSERAKLEVADPAGAAGDEAKSAPNPDTNPDTTPNPEGGSEEEGE